jgi:hypothetical protein
MLEKTRGLVWRWWAPSVTGDSPQEVWWCADDGEHEKLEDGDPVYGERSLRY